jgi:hypothetical protein
VVYTRGQPAGILTACAALLALAGVLANLLENRRATNLTHARELYTEAVGQLGSDTLDVRLGGIYALERIATDYAADHRIVVEVLSAFVREHTTPGRAGTARRSRNTSLPTPADRLAGTTAHRPAELDTDIQAALTVLGRLPTRRSVARADLIGAHLPGADLRGANLTRVSLDGADLFEAQMDGANLTRADLRGGEPVQGRPERADLFEAQMDGANLTRVSLDGANLSGARLGGMKWLSLSALSYWLNSSVNRRLNPLRGLTHARGLTWAQLTEAHGDAATVLPARLNRPASWGDT